TATKLEPGETIADFFNKYIGEPKSKPEEQTPLLSLPMSDSILNTDTNAQIQDPTIDHSFLEIQPMRKGHL
uniref:hypothetical protein n=1 Tax=Klebsiella pneumoniae TaxID=573 RepID=UPI001C8F827B